MTILSTRTHLKNRFLVQDSVFATLKAWLRRYRRGGTDFKPQVRPRRIEDLKRGTHPAEKGGRPKAIFEMGSRLGRRLLSMSTLQTFTWLIVFVGAYLNVAPAEGLKTSSQNTEKSRIQITADKLVAELDVSEIEFVGNVKVTRADAIITSDRLKIIYDPDQAKDISSARKKESIEKIIANGNVKIVADDIIAETDKAEYSIKSDVLVLQGEQSSITREGYSITGKKFTLRRTEGQITVESSEEQRVKAIMQP
jgi:lipopolysaccharide export system protein LptA